MTTIDAIEEALPETFYAALPIDRRVARMADEWRRAIKACHQLEEDNDILRKQKQVLQDDARRRQPHGNLSES